jgi:hypothetical protein
MRETRVPLTEIQPGEMIVRIGRREVNARFRELADLRSGTRVSGPRGGQYAVNAHGAAALVTVVTYVGRPVVDRAATAVVLRNAE